MDENPLILVIDDDEETQAYAVDALKHCGYSALGATTPATALELIRTLPSLRLVLSDVELGPIRGPALIRQALRDRPELKVVFMTGSYTDIGVRHSDPVLAKPFHFQELCMTVRAILAAKPKSDRLAASTERRRPPSMN